MKQPKFKFGDKVINPGWKAPCTVNGFKSSSEGIIVFVNEYDLGFMEFDLELYQEPQKKRLYAYHSQENHGKVDFFRTPVIGIEHRAWPEYDIEYPETKVD